MDRVEVQDEPQYISLLKDIDICLVACSTPSSVFG